MVKLNSRLPNSYGEAGGGGRGGVGKVEGGRWERGKEGSTSAMPYR